MSGTEMARRSVLVVVEGEEPLGGCSCSALWCEGLWEFYWIASRNNICRYRISSGSVICAGDPSVLEYVAAVLGLQWSVGDRDSWGGLRILEGPHTPICACVCGANV